MIISWQQLARVISFLKMYDLFVLNHNTLDQMCDVTPVTDELMDRGKGKWKIWQHSERPKTAKGDFVDKSCPCFKKENIWSAEEKRNREGKGGKYLEKEKVMTDIYTDAQTDFPHVDSTSSTEVVDPFHRRNRAKNWNTSGLLLSNLLFQECLNNKNEYN